MPPVLVPGQQADSDGEAMAFLATDHFVRLQRRLSRYFDMFGFQSEYREDTRRKISQDLAAMRLPQLDVTSSRLHMPSRPNVTTSITCQALLSLGSCLVTDRCAGQVRSDQGYGEESHFHREQAWLPPPDVQRRQDGIDAD